LIKAFHIKGLLLAIAIGTLALFIGSFTPSYFNSILIALLLGILINNLIVLPVDYEPGLSYTSGKMLEYSIIFLAFSINYVSIVQLGAISFTGILVTVFVVLIAIVFLSKKLKCPSSTGLLIGFGTAICGSSAIAALAPSVSKDKEDVAAAMAVVNLFGSLGMLSLPFLLPHLNLSDHQSGFVIGGSLHSVGNVVGAGYAMGDKIGEASLTIKLARVALLSPALIFFNFLVNRNSAASWRSYFKIPWYLVGFFIISILVSFISLDEVFINWTETIGKWVLTIALAAIGLKVSFKKLIESGKKGLMFGLIIFLIQLSLLFIFVYLI
jgi:uncharacterized integral membrane protein (TIGR00698 family)